MRKLAIDYKILNIYALILIKIAFVIKTNSMVEPKAVIINLGKTIGSDRFFSRIDAILLFQIVAHHNCISGHIDQTLRLNTKQSLTLTENNRTKPDFCGD